VLCPSLKRTLSAQHDYYHPLAARGPARICARPRPPRRRSDALSRCHIAERTRRRPSQTSASSTGSSAGPRAGSRGTRWTPTPAVATRTSAPCPMSSPVSLPSAFLWQPIMVKMKRAGGASSASTFSSQPASSASQPASASWGYAGEGGGPAEPAPAAAAAAVPVAVPAALQGSPHSPPAEGSLGASAQWGYRAAPPAAFGVPAWGPDGEPLSRRR